MFNVNLGKNYWKHFYFVDVVNGRCRSGARQTTAITTLCELLEDTEPHKAGET